MKETEILKELEALQNDKLELLKDVIREEFNLWKYYLEQKRKIQIIM